MIKQVTRHVEWRPIAGGNTWFAKLDGKVVGYVKHLKSGRIESRVIARRGIRQHATIHEAARSVVANINFMNPSQLPR